MFSRKSVHVFILRFVLFFGLLLLPWKPACEQIATLTRVELRLLLRLFFPSQSFNVGMARSSSDAGRDISVTMSDLSSRGTDQNEAPIIKEMMFGSRSVWWIPHAMFIALCAASPPTGKDKIKWWAAGLLAAHFLVVAKMLVALFFGSLIPGSPWLERVFLKATHRLLVENFWADFVLPALVWLSLLVFRGYGQFAPLENYKKARTADSRKRGLISGTPKT